MREKTVAEVANLHFAIDAEDTESEIISYLLGRYFCSTAIDYTATDDDEALNKAQASLEPFTKCVSVRVNQATLVYPPDAEEELEIIDLSDCEDQERQRELAWIKNELLEEFVSAHEDEGNRTCLPQRLCSISQTDAGRYRLQLVGSRLCWSSRDLACLTDGLGHSPASVQPQRTGGWGSSPSPAEGGEFSLLHHWLEQALVLQQPDASALAALRQNLEMLYPFSRFWADNLNTASAPWGAQQHAQAEHGEPGEARPPTLAGWQWETSPSDAPERNGKGASPGTAALLAAIGLTVCLYTDSPVLQLRVLGLGGDHRSGSSAAVVKVTLTYSPETTLAAWLEQIQAALNAPAAALEHRDLSDDPIPTILIESLDCPATPEERRGETAVLRELDLAHPAYPWTFSVLQTPRGRQLSHTIAHGSTAPAETEVLCESIHRMHQQLLALSSAGTVADLVQAFSSTFGQRQSKGDASDPNPNLEPGPTGSTDSLPSGQRLRVIEAEHTFDAEAMAQRSAWIAKALSARSTAPQRVMLLLKPGASYIAAVQCMAEAGHTYMTCDDSYPLQRVLDLTEAFKPDVLLFEGATEAIVSAMRQSGSPGHHFDILKIADSNGIGEEAQSLDHTSKGLAGAGSDTGGGYVIYTSGSTGAPKAIEQTVSNALYFAAQYASTLGITSESTITQIGSIAHDATIVDIYTGLITGCKLFSYNIKQHGLERLSDSLNQNRVDVLHCTPSVLRELSYGMLRRAEKLDTISTIALGGEQVLASDLSLIKRICSKPCRVLNLYGSSEASFTFRKIVDPNDNAEFDSVPIGQSLDAVQWKLIDSQGLDNPFVGQLQIQCRHSYPTQKGRKVTNRLDTSKTEPNETELPYNTGDWGRRLHNGEVLCLGRHDSQVKIRGFRVSKLEIEQAICRHPAVLECCVIDVRDESGNLELVAFATCQPSHLSEPKDQLSMKIKGDLFEKMPMYMVPTKLMLCEALPKTATGKINRRALALN